MRVTFSNTCRISIHLEPLSTWVWQLNDKKSHALTLNSYWLTLMAFCWCRSNRVKVDRQALILMFGNLPKLNALRTSSGPRQRLHNFLKQMVTTSVLSRENLFFLFSMDHKRCLELCKQLDISSNGSFHRWASKMDWWHEMPNIWIPDSTWIPALTWIQDLYTSKHIEIHNI